MKIEQDPTPVRHDHPLLDVPRVAADLGYEWIWSIPHPDLLAFNQHPSADDRLVKGSAMASSAAGVGMVADIGFCDSDSIVRGNAVFAEDERAHDMARFQPQTMTDHVAAHRGPTKDLR